MENLSKIKHVILVLSGKGGVGKSTVSVQLALALAQSGLKVGILDVDICGPSVPQMLGLGDEQEVHQSEAGWVPVYLDSSKKISVMSIAFLLNSKNDAVIWRGPKKHSMIKQFMEDVYWEDAEYLIVDTPPGTSDEHMSVMESLKLFPRKSAILVTTPQLISVGDVRREVTFCHKLKINILGIIENYSSFNCPNCQDCSSIFGQNGGQILSTETGIPLLAQLPLDPNLVKCCESGENFIEKFSESKTCEILKNLRDNIITKIENQ